MATVSMHFDASPDRTWQALSQPRAYGFWVTGAHAIHETEGEWPQTGATFSHSQGIPPLTISDTTSVQVSDPPRRLQLEARVRPLLVARIVLVIEPEPAGGRVAMEETAIDGLVAPLLRLPPGEALIRARNVESLRRLRQVARARE